MKKFNLRCHFYFSIHVKVGKTIGSYLENDLGISNLNLRGSDKTRTVKNEFHLQFPSFFWKLINIGIPYYFPNIGTWRKLDDLSKYSNFIF